VHRVGDVVCPVHDLRLQAGPASRSAVPDPFERLSVIVVTPELARSRARLRLLARLRGKPGVFQGGVEGGSGQVEAGAWDLRLEPGQQPQTLCVALEATAARRDLGQRELAVMAERRVSQVMGQARRVD